MKTRIIALSGSLRRDSYTTKLVKAFQKSAPEDVALELIEIGNLPFINEDLEKDLPESVKAFHEKIRESEAVLFATPEYNRSYSPVLKNAIDWGSRPEGQNHWNNKPAAAIGCSPYSLGAFGAVNHLRQVMMYVNLLTLQEPEFYLSKASCFLGEDGNVSDPETQNHIDAFWIAFTDWIERLKR
ncbi:NADPH-dependent FMN reductase [Flavobacterium sp. 3HN19-14]|uniref:NADPH-dependent FMN reductase n=1 Tax=Flavobacterium sp. 3HN19-14 TaxID=3448133 RepID=UPI003EE01DC2